ncbi:MAG TPA: Ser-Thr-rich GPI-anchored membrane family protein [Anaerolineae bacterium]|nr:Ser-Thr-rich GPI-anchored membrane family protein [Anaerolineae bacterium]
MTSTRQILIPLLLISLLAALVLMVITTTGGTATVTIEWSTASELNTAGFNLYRGETKDGPFTRINADLIPASPDPLIGGSYIFTDTAVVAGRTYYFQLEDVETNGTATVQGVVEVKADGGLDPAVLIALAAVIVIAIGSMVFLRRKRSAADVQT